MKKILLLIVIIFMCSACYDYEEITDSAIIIGIGLTKENEKYKVSTEILSDEEKQKSYIMDEYGDNITDTFKNLENKIAKNVKYSKVKILLIDKTIDLNDIKDYFLRNYKFTNNFYLFYTYDNIYKILSNDKDNNINTFKIMNLVNETNSNILLNPKDAFDFQIDRLNNNSDIVIPIIKLDNKDIILDGMYIYNKFYLNKDETKIYGLLKNKIKNNLFTTNNNSIEVINSIIKYKENNLNIFIEAKIKMMNSFNNINDLENSFENYLKDNINRLIDKCIEYDSNILDINNNYNIIVNIKENN